MTINGGAISGWTTKRGRGAQGLSDEVQYLAEEALDTGTVYSADGFTSYAKANTEKKRLVAWAKDMGYLLDPRSTVRTRDDKTFSIEFMISTSNSVPDLDTL